MVFQSVNHWFVSLLVNGLLPLLNGLLVWQSMGWQSGSVNGLLASYQRVCQSMVYQSVSQWCGSHWSVSLVIICLLVIVYQSVSQWSVSHWSVSLVIICLLVNGLLVCQSMVCQSIVWQSMGWQSMVCQSGNQWAGSQWSVSVLLNGM